MARMLIDGGYLIPMSKPDEAVPDGVVAIQDDRIAYSGARDGFDARAFDRECAERIWARAGAMFGA